MLVCHLWSPDEYWLIDFKILIDYKILIDWLQNVNWLQNNDWLQNNVSFQTAIYLFGAKWKVDDRGMRVVYCGFARRNMTRRDHVTHSFLLASLTQMRWSTVSHCLYYLSVSLNFRSLISTQVDFSPTHPLLETNLYSWAMPSIVAMMAYQTQPMMVSMSRRHVLALDILIFFPSLLYFKGFWEEGYTT